MGNVNDIMEKISKEDDMMSALTNVSVLNHTNVFFHINTFLRSIRDKSSNTAENYERDIRTFFRVMKNKEIEEIIDEDIVIKLPDLMQYRTLLLESKQYKNTTINRMMASLESLYRFLRASEYNVNPFIFNKFKLPDDTNHIGIITPSEAVQLSKLALFERYNGLEIKALIMLAASTSIRKSAINKIKYSHIRPHTTKKNVYLIEGDQLFDKGKEVVKEIHSVLYQELLDLRSDKQRDDYIFTISPSSLDAIIKRLCKKAGFDEDRNLSWHSLRKTGVMFVDEATNGDMVAITAQGNWSSPTVAYNSYIGPQRKVNLAGTAMFETMDDNVLEELSKEEMLQLLRSFEGGLGYQIKKKAQEIIENR